MATAGYVGFGSTFKGTTYSSNAAMAQVTSISVDGISADDIEFSAMDSTDGFKEYKAGMVDPGTVTVEAEYTEAGAAIIFAKAKIGQTTNDTFTITFPGNDYLAFSGYVNSVSLSDPHNGAITASVGVKVSGVPTYTAA